MKYECRLRLATPRFSLSASHCPLYSMEILPSTIFSLVLLLVSGVLMLGHWRSWRASRQRELPPAEYDYRRRQFRRRMQASGMIGIVGIALFVGVAFFLGRESLFPWIEDVVVIVAYWLAVLLIIVWMGLLALVDVWASRRYVGRLLDDDLLEQTKLHANLYRQSRAKQNPENAGDQNPDAINKK
jgi:hypothetical protein